MSRTLQDGGKRCPECGGRTVMAVYLAERHRVVRTRFRTMAEVLYPTSLSLLVLGLGVALWYLMTPQPWMVPAVLAGVALVFLLYIRRLSAWSRCVMRAWALPATPGRMAAVSTAAGVWNVLLVFDILMTAALMLGLLNAG